MLRTMRLGGLSSSLFALVGCGDDPVNRLPDAPPSIDGGVDGAIDAAPPPATVVTTLVRCCEQPAGTPQAKVPVVVLGPDGALAQMSMTGVDGKVTFQNVAPGSAITAFYPETANFNNTYVTVAAVQPGDQLTFGDNYYDDDNPAGVDGTTRITYPAAAQATSYYGDTLCSSASDPAPATLMMAFPQFTYCQKPTMSAVLYAADGAGNTVASAYVAAADGTDGGTTVVPAWTPFPTAPNVTTSFPNPPPEVNDTSLFVTAVFPLGANAFADYTLLVGASETVTLPTNGVRQFHGARLRRNGDFGAKFAYASAAATATTATFSTPATLPWVSNQVSMSSLGVGWLQTPGTYDAAHVDVNWSVFDGKNSHNYHWSIIAPPGQTQFAWSQFPSALADRLPPVDAFVFGDIALVDLNSTADYDAARAIPEWQLAVPAMAVRFGDQSRADVAVSDGGEGGVVDRLQRRPSTRVPFAQRVRQHH